MKDESHPHRGWFAHLKDSVKQDFAKCNFCNHYSTRLGCRCHNYKCDKCGKVLWREYLNGGNIRFSFKKCEEYKTVSLKIHSFLDKTQEIVCYPDYYKGNHWLTLTEDKFHAYMEEFKDEYRVIGQKLYAFYCPNKRDENIKINIAEVNRGDSEEEHCHYRYVTLYKGEECDKLPVRDMYMIYDTYKDAPIKHTSKLAQNIIHAARQVARCDYYYQDGRDAFYDGQLKWMADYINHFTDLKGFDRFTKVCRRDGPGFIVHLSYWVEAQTGVRQEIINEPNIGNLIIGMSKLGNERLTEDEFYTMLDAANDKKTRELWNKCMLEERRIYDYH